MTKEEPDEQKKRELDNARHEFQNMCLTMREQMMPVFDTADGIRADMLGRGYSPTAAEQTAVLWLHGAMSLAFQGAPE